MIRLIPLTPLLPCHFTISFNGGDYSLCYLLSVLLNNTVSVFPLASYLTYAGYYSCTECVTQYCDFFLLVVNLTYAGYYSCPESVTQY
jgi:hypothetical protein